MSAPVVIFTNQKGGVGKTTHTRELGIALAARGMSVLLIDSDPQGNLTKSLLVRTCRGSTSFSKVILRRSRSFVLRFRSSRAIHASRL